MVATTVSVNPPRHMSEREELRSNLEATRARFHALLDAVSDEQWRRKSPSSDWTLAEVFVHLTWALEQLPREVQSARRGKEADCVTCIHRRRL